MMPKEISWDRAEKKQADHRGSQAELEGIPEDQFGDQIRKASKEAQTGRDKASENHQSERDFGQIRDAENAHVI